MASRIGRVVLRGCLIAGVFIAIGCNSTTPSGADAQSDAPIDASTDVTNDASGADALDITPGLDADAGDDASTDAPFVTADHTHYPPVVLPDGGTGVVQTPRLVSIVAGNDTMGSQLLTFGDALVASAWWRSWSADYGVGAPSANIRITGPSITSSPMSVPQLTTYVQNAVAASPSNPSPDGHTIYVLYLPDGVFTDRGADANGCGVSFHTTYAPSSLGDGIAFVTRCPPRAGQTAFEALTTASSHEIAEAATDTGSGWALARPPTASPWMYSVFIEDEGGAHTEVGDLCSLDTRIRESGYVFQRIFSNSAAALGGDPCVPHHAVPYYSVTAPQDWYAAPPPPSSGAWTVTIPLTGWSTAATDDWIVRTSTPYGSNATLNLMTRIDSTTTVTIGSQTYKTTNNGRMTPLVATLPAGAPSGTWWVIIVRSERLDSSGAPPTDDDFAHRWLVGIYVP